jgi:hypothetical protein
MYILLLLELPVNIVDGLDGESPEFGHDDAMYFGVFQEV